ncbi:MAG: hypothetical protein FJ027_03705 [Candidatus Rokubacteria bacterium]|nr:hypothetical protein [Candidatus Rokubacteria bacterium]
MSTSPKIREISVALRRRATAVRGETQRLIARSRQLCRTPPPPPRSSSADVDNVAEALGDRALCLECLARKGGMSNTAVLFAITRLRRTVQLRLTIERCDGCLYRTASYRLGR